MPISKNYISLADLYLAYRKAKSEAFFDNVHPSAIAFTEYEQNLSKNLNNLLKRLNAKNVTWTKDIDFLGSFTYAPKSINDDDWNGNDKVHFRAIDPQEDWKNRFELSGSIKAKAKYRLVIDAQVNFHIISALWIMKIGHNYEGKLNQQVSYGNRLRRYTADIFSPKGESGELNEHSIGLFQPYFSAYKSWREKGLETMRSSMIAKKSVNAITMDLKGFYHNVSPEFMLREEFLKELDITLSSDEHSFTRYLLDAINNWYASTPDYESREEGALPIGLSASKIISNVLLYQFDKEMIKGLNPSYYGRYVDDIFLVVECEEYFKNGDDAVNWIEGEVPCLNKLEGGNLKINLPYANDCELIFSPDKQKIFFLSSEHGLDLVEHIHSQIKKQSSEYRMLADVPDNAGGMAAKALLATPDSSLEADALRKADVVSVRRLGFSLLLGDIENYAGDLKPKEWKPLRLEFYGLVQRHLLTPRGIFEFTNYLHRIFGLMVSCNDFEEINDFLSGLTSSFKLINDTTVSENTEHFKLFKQFICNKLKQIALQASTNKGFEGWDDLKLSLNSLNDICELAETERSIDDLKEHSYQVLLADLGSRTYKNYWYYSQEKDINLKAIPRKKEVISVLKLASVRTYRKQAQLPQPHWLAISFPTRPLSIQEIAVICPEVLNNTVLFKRAVLGLRGAKIRSNGRVGFIRTNRDKTPDFFNMPNKHYGDKKRKTVIALTSLETSNEQWQQCVDGNPDRTLKRYQNLLKLTNRVLQEPNRPDYLVFPELSIPRKWAFSMAQKLARNGISLICGLEYYPHLKEKNVLRNDCFISLVTRWPGYMTNVIMFQPKLEPSHNERKNLEKSGKTQFEPQSAQSSLPVYSHGNFTFGVLICSDLTNIANRIHFQGHIDSLFVLEWNPDLNTFNFLIESSAHDIHTSVIQVNNRAYGDSRIRTPFKLEYKRDSVRVKGGLEDFYVIGDIDHHSLRRYQLEPNMENPQYKPLPIGFKMSPFRRFSASIGKNINRIKQDK